MDMQRIADVYGAYMWRVSNRYKYGIWSQRDIFHELLIRIYSAMKTGKLPTDATDEGIRKVRSFIITKAIDINRYENYRQNTTKEDRNFRDSGPSYEDPNFVRHKGFHSLDGEFDMPHSYSLQQILQEIHMLEDLLYEKLTPRDARILLELVFPSQDTYNIANAEKGRKLEEGGLKMNVRNDKIFMKHAASALGYELSPATLSRIKSKTKELLEEVYSG